MANSLAAMHKEAIAEQLVRLVRLNPLYSRETFSLDTHMEIAINIDELRMQTLYLKLYDIAFSLISSYGLADNERLSAAVDIVELVRNKLTGNE
jgi:hypothetical protein